MKFYSVKELAKICGKSDRTIYRHLKNVNLFKSDLTKKNKTILYSERILNILLGKPDTSAKDNEIESLKREIQTLKFANEQLSKFTQEAFDSLKREQTKLNYLKS
jgi:transcriptional antiterminator